MICNAKQDYRYALNQNGNIINVRTAVRTDKYICPCCGSEMIPHMGKIRKWHFTHKVGISCNYETYLHKVAKARIREAFLSSESFLISFNPEHICDAECPFKKDPKCVARLQKSFDIRSYYDVCEEEVPFNGFRPDLLLRSSLFPERDPIFIEIHVSHKSTPSKIASGHRIIELTVESEEDIDEIVKKSKISGVSSKTQYLDLNREKCVFFNFNLIYPTLPSEHFFDSKYVFALKDNGFSDDNRVYCFEPISEYFRITEYNIILSNVPINRLWAYAEFEKRGLDITNCLRCKFYKHTMNGEPICILYKKYGTPKSPQIKEARTCPHYKKSQTDEYGNTLFELRPQNDGMKNDVYFRVFMRKKK